MSIKPVSILGGKSVYCISEGQLRDAFDLYENDSEAGPRIQAKLEDLEANMSRNERAALAFIVNSSGMRFTDLDLDVVLP